MYNQIQPVNMVNTHMSIMHCKHCKNTKAECSCKETWEMIGTCASGQLFLDASRSNWNFRGFSTAGVKLPLNDKPLDCPFFLNAS